MENLPYFGDVDAIEIAITTIDEVLKSGKFPNGKKVTDKHRSDLIKEKEELIQILPK